MKFAGNRNMDIKRYINYSSRYCCQNAHVYEFNADIRDKHEFQ